MNLQLLITRSPPQFQGDVPTKIASNNLSKYPNGDQSLKYIDRFNRGD